MECKVMENRIKVYDSFSVPKADIEKELLKLKERFPEHCVWNRSMRSMVLEWAAHNLLFSLNIKVEKTKDVDLDYPQKWYYRFAYFIIGNIALQVID